MNWILLTLALLCGLGAIYFGVYVDDKPGALIFSAMAIILVACMEIRGSDDN